MIFSESNSEASPSESDSEELHLAKESETETNSMANPPRTLRELATPGINQQHLCIEFPVLATPFELKSGLIHLLPCFRGFTGEDPHKHLKELHVVCSSMKPNGVTDEQIKLRAFPFSLADKAKDWLYYLPPRSIRSWNEMEKIFLEKFFPASRVGNIRKEICGIKQMTRETLHEYWERFQQLTLSCPQHQVPEQLLLQYFYDGLLFMDRNMIDAASGGALMNKTPEEARNLISSMAANAQQFGNRQEVAPHKVKEEVNHSINQKLDMLTSVVQQMVISKAQSPQNCST